jgi:TPP-dependent pyruvate/acetoin dehydrogenase alpha subunit
MMRMKGHAIHDAAQYVPRELFDYWTRRDPIARFENYLVKVKKWLSPKDNDKLIADVEAQLERDRDFAVNSPMPAPESAGGGVYCDPSCHDIKPKYAMPKFDQKRSPAKSRQSEAAVHLK